MMRRLQKPLLELYPWDKQAGEAACIAQVMQLNGKLELPFDPVAWDRRIGRQPGQPDLAKGGVRTLLEEGFEVLGVNPVDSQRVVDDKEYVGGAWLELGFPPEAVALTLDRAYPQIRARNLYRLELEREYPHDFRRVGRKATWQDVVWLVNDGYQVLCDILATPITTYPLLVMTKLYDAWFEVYTPLRGVQALHGDLDLAPAVLPMIEAYRLAE